MRFGLFSYGKLYSLKRLNDLVKSKMGKYTKLLLKYIPGGAHTYSRGADTFPINAPEILLKGKGVKIYDLKNKEFIDYGMGLRSVNIGYAEPAVDRAAFLE